MRDGQPASRRCAYPKATAAADRRHPLIDRRSKLLQFRHIPSQIPPKRHADRPGRKRHHQRNGDRPLTLFQRLVDQSLSLLDRDRWRQRGQCFFRRRKIVLPNRLQQIIHRRGLPGRLLHLSVIGSRPSDSRYFAPLTPPLTPPLATSFVPLLKKTRSRRRPNRLARTVRGIHGSEKNEACLDDARNVCFLFGFAWPKGGHNPFFADFRWITRFRGFTASILPVRMKTASVRRAVLSNAWIRTTVIVNPMDFARSGQRSAQLFPPKSSHLRSHSSPLPLRWRLVGCRAIRSKRLSFARC